MEEKREERLRWLENEHGSIENGYAIMKRKYEKHENENWKLRAELHYGKRASKGKLLRMDESYISLANSFKTIERAAEGSATENKRLKAVMAKLKRR